MSLIFRHLDPETSGGHVLMLTNSEYMSVKHWFTTLPANLLLLWTMYRRVQMIQMWLVVVLLFHTHILNPLLLALGTMACTFDRREAYKAVESVNGHVE